MLLRAYPSCTLTFQVNIKSLGKSYVDSRDCKVCVSSDKESYASIWWDFYCLTARCISFGNSGYSALDLAIESLDYSQDSLGSWPWILPSKDGRMSVEKSIKRYRYDAVEGPGPGQGSHSHLTPDEDRLCSLRMRGACLACAAPWG